MKLKSLLLLFLACLTAGCAATLPDLRQSAPNFTLISEQPPKILANAITYESQLGLDSWGCSWNPAQINEIDGIFKILVTLTSGLFGVTTTPIAEITIKPAAGGGSFLEYRSGNIWGPCKDRFWYAVVQKFASSKTTREIATD